MLYSSIPPLFLNNVYNIDSNYVYSRMKNYNQSILESQLCNLYGYNLPCTVLSSGMMCFSALLHTLCKDNSHIILCNTIYSEIKELINNFHHNIDVTEVDLHNKIELKKSIKDNTKLVILCNPSNPFYEQYNVSEIKDTIKECNNKTMLCVDNSVLSIYYSNPLNQGADIVIESLSKYIDGYGDSIGGFIIGIDVYEYSSIVGCGLRPFECWTIQKGLSTLSLRLDKITETSKKIYKYLLSINSDVYYCNTGGMITFSNNKIKNIKEFINDLNIFFYGYSFGNSESLISYNEYNGVIYYRLSIGLENADDLIDDLNTSFIHQSLWG